eukprot:138825_1
MAAATDNKKVQPMEVDVIEANATLNLSHIIDDFDTYSKGDSVTTKCFTLGDVEFNIVCYPKGLLLFCDSKGEIVNSDESEQSHVAMYINAVTCEAKDTRTVRVVMKHDTMPHREFYRTVAGLKKSGRGWSNWMTLAAIGDSPNVTINIKLIDNPLFVSKSYIPTFSDQNKMMHDLNLLHGDITLFVNTSDANSFSLPLKKKDKSNGPFECKICYKTFATYQALASHLSNKADTEHNNYRNNVDLDSECVIKMSSVVLRAASKVFDKMLSSNMMEKQHNTIEIHAKSIEDVKDLTYFMSTNELKENSNALHLIALAHYYEMDRLFWKCVYALIKNLTVRKFAQTLQIFDKYEIELGYDSLVQFAKKNREALKKADDYETISHAFKCLALKNEKED